MDTSIHVQYEIQGSSYMTGKVHLLQVFRGIFKNVGMMNLNFLGYIKEHVNSLFCFHYTYMYIYVYILSLYTAYIFSKQSEFNILSSTDRLILVTEI